MRKISGIIFIIFIITIFVGFVSKPSLAFDRNAIVSGARVVSISNFTYNTNSVNISLNSGPVIVGSTDHSLPAYAQIAQITAQIQALKEKLKSSHP